MSSCATEATEENETDEVSDDKMMRTADRDDVMCDDVMMHVIVMRSRSATAAVL